MRNYYWDIFQRTFPDTKRSISKFKGWHFVEVWLKDLFKANSEEINYDVIVMVDDILQLFELDLVQYNEKPISVRSLLSYRLFWIDLYQNPSIVNYEVKDLIQMWIRSSEESNQVLNRITRFLCLMLEMLWKWSNIENFFDLSTWPMHSSFMPLANEFLRQFQDVNAETLLKLVKAVPVPWHQLYLGSLAYRSKIDKSELDVELTFPYLKSKLCEECNLCTKEEKNEEFPHTSK
ncbi:hypothetical protein Anas_09581 [Armadillidium nasatum]|uniref:Uncharacterized protein n=1 Tax=Armadillidium nasatum TaxID=96803 RepID=A0A5N5SLW8_9CRUS|nr:hypothetical protein Anas_09581 [Armadillidium nasatum]